MHVMLDLETLGTNPNSAIIAIGATAFDPFSPSHSRFYRNIVLKSCVEIGAEIDPDTIIWWMQQSDEARAELVHNALPVTQALEAFLMWLAEVPELEGVWGNGASFDNVLIAQTAKMAGLGILWSHKLDRCYRTVANMNHNQPLVRSGTYHNALDDAITQADHLIHIDSELGCIL